jgi:hypothetical protein
MVNESGNREKFDELVNQLAKKSSKTQKQIRELISDKLLKFKHQISEIAAIKILYKELGYEMVSKPNKKGESSPNEDNWITVGFYNRVEDSFNWKADYKDLLAGVKTKYLNDKINGLLENESQWEIIGNDDKNASPKGNAIFMRLTKSGSGVGFYIGKTYVFISKKLWIEGENKFMPISAILGDDL